MVLNANFINISAISWWSVVLVEETGVPGETCDLSHVTDSLHHIEWYRVHLAMNGVRTHNVSGLHEYDHDGPTCVGLWKFYRLKCVSGREFTTVVIMERQIIYKHLGASKLNGLSRIIKHRLLLPIPEGVQIDLSFSTLHYAN
jgi:hypothetical protein